MAYKKAQLAFYCQLRRGADSALKKASGEVKPCTELFIMQTMDEEDCF